MHRCVKKRVVCIDSLACVILAKKIKYRIRQIFKGKTFAVFTVLQPTTKVLPLNHLLYIVHDGHGLMHRKSLQVNSVFCAQLPKFSPSKVLPYSVVITV